MVIPMNPYTMILKMSMVLVWFGMIAFLIIDVEDRPEPLMPVSVELLSNATEQWFGIYLQNQKIGYLYRSTEPKETGYYLREEGRLQLRLGETLQTVQLETEAWTTKRSELDRFSFSLTSEAIQMQVEGEVQSDHMSIRVNHNGRIHEEQIPLSQPIHLPHTLERFLIQLDPQPGERFTFSLFDPTTFSQGEMEVEIEGWEMMKVGIETQSVLRVKGYFKGLTVRSWITRTGDVLREESPGGMILLAQEEQQARILPLGASVPDLLSLTAAPSSRMISNPRSVQRLTIKLHGWKRGDVLPLTIEMPRISELGRYQLPFEEDSDLLPYIRPERFIQSDHPSIQEVAYDIMGNEADVQLIVERLTEWVYRSVRKAYTISFPDALTVLELRSGDCNEHTVLFTALARAVGIPTRMAAGLVYLDDRFYYHAWPEVWMGQWVAVDPTFGQFPADATHIRLTIGGLDKQTQLVETIGQLEIEVVSLQ